MATDGFLPYVNAIDTGLSDRVDYAMLVKVYVSPREGEQRQKHRGDSLRHWLIRLNHPDEEQLPRRFGLLGER